MIFELKNIGKVTVENTLKCEMVVSSENLFKESVKYQHWLSPSSIKLLKSSMDSKKESPISETENRELCSFFMEFNTDLMKKDMDSMRICGAAHFIPPQFRDKK
jgi:hypothetical protein